MPTGKTTYTLRRMPTKGLTVRIVMPRRMRLRLWLAHRLLGLAARLCEFTVQDDHAG